jgi:acyl-CoA reductase-like NAD-dependent aldehyde dehydrogenase
MTSAPSSASRLSALDLNGSRQAVLIGGQWRDCARRLEVHDKYTDEVIASVGYADSTLVDEAVSVAAQAFRQDAFPHFQRYEVLTRAAALIESRRDVLVERMVAESGFTRSDCMTEVSRCVQTLLLSGEEARRMSGEMVPVHGAPSQDPRKLAFTLRRPLGVVCAITPFNSPLNTVAHKLGPALAAGNSVVLKPSSYVPLTATMLCLTLLEAGVPPGFVNIVYGGADVGTCLLEDPRVRFYTFTGSTEVGRIIQRHAGLRRTQLELGNISATIVCADANLDLAAERCVGAAFRKAGQVCTSVQRILVERDILERFTSALVDRAERLVVGDPKEPGTFVGPMIHEGEAARAEAWVGEAREGGARVLTGGKRDGALFRPTIIADAGRHMKVLCEEIFAPVITLVGFDHFDEAITMANDTPFGLAAGVFTSDITRALEAARRLEMGSIHINDTSSSRVDLMPYGGVKDSGFGQEGPKYAAREMSEECLVTLNPC